MKKKDENNVDEYRSERKERLNKQSKKSDKKHKSHEKAKRTASKIIGSVIAVVVVVAIVLASLNFLGVPQKVLKAVTIDGESYSMSELSCYYMLAYNNVYSYAYSYESNYGDGYGVMLTGYDITLSPDEQTTTNDDGETVTWSEYFMEEAIEQMALVKRYYAKALEYGIELSEEDQEEIDESMDSFRSASRSGYSVSRYISKIYGKGVNESLMEKVITEQQYVSAYQEQRQEEIEASYGDDDVYAEYENDVTAYDVVDFRWFTIDVTSTDDEEDDEETETSETSTSEDETSASEDESSASEEEELLSEEIQAQEFIDDVTSQTNYDVETFKATVLEYADPDSDEYSDYQEDAGTLLEKTDKDTIETNVSEDAASWLFEQDDDGNYVRQLGDMSYFLNSDEDTVYIFFALGQPYQNTTKAASVRHILVMFPEDEDSSEDTSDEDTSEEETEETTVSAEDKAECSSKADEILAEYESYIDEYEDGSADEDYFAELASEYSDDSGTSSDGGLIEDMENNGAYVEEFENWVFAEGDYEGETREAGVTGIIETEYGYHVMYYVSNHDNPTWYETILADLVEEAWDEESTEFEESFGEDAIKLREYLVKRVRKSCVNLIG